MIASRLRRFLLPLVALLALGGCQTLLNAGLTERAANEEVALLLRAGIPASRAAEPKSATLSVFVEQSRFADAVDLLNAHGLPKPRHDSIADVFKGNGLVVSPIEEQARLVYALDEDLSRTIAEIDGVLAAHVHIVTQDNDPLRRNVLPASASVFVRYTADSQVKDLVPQIKLLVANGVAGLSYDKVSVVLVAAEVAPAPETQAPHMQNVLGLWLYTGSAQELQLVAAGAASLLTLLLALIAWLAWRARGGSASRPAGTKLALR